MRWGPKAPPQTSLPTSPQLPPLGPAAKEMKGTELTLGRGGVGRGESRWDLTGRDFRSSWRGVGQCRAGIWQSHWCPWHQSIHRLSAK